MLSDKVTDSGNHINILPENCVTMADGLYLYAL